MKQVFKTNDPVKLSFAESVLRDAGIEPAVLDENTSSLYGGGLPFIQRRIMVVDEDERAALAALQAAFEDAGQSMKD
ncbi:DUF2007 domain-containing protein [Maricaulis sp.]|uniref:putative signal transducing protein n=1 Tax=unclassified Maricaulis TaxID=2632371 RepID=UPI001AFDAF30|nr:DUF2007 domain-containing protein [Maricaulis sp.]MBO6797527.1 DUF2007 domain-containing protein [Maricaulis sp.]